MREAFLQSLLWVVLPLWSLAGFSDWLCHRRTGIEHSSGALESGFHLALVTFLAVPLCMALLFELTGPVVALIILGLVLHQIASYLDTSYADPRRRISPLEQHIHGFMDLLPFTAAFIVIVLYRDTWSSRPFEFVWREPALAPAYVGVTVGALVLAYVLIAEELWRCAAARKAHVNRSATLRKSATKSL